MYMRTRVDEGVCVYVCVCVSMAVVGGSGGGSVSLYARGHVYVCACVSRLMMSHHLVDGQSTRVLRSVLPFD